MRYSQKPFTFFEIVEKMVPGGPYIEFFMRHDSAREWWLGVGDESIFSKPKEKAES